MAKEKSAEMVSKVTLSTGKVVLIREMRIRHQELAAEAAAPRAGENAYLFQIFMQKEILKQLIATVDGAKLTPVQMEKLDEVFTPLEYGQLLRVLKKLMGDEVEMGKFRIEHVSSGDN